MKNLLTIALVLVSASIFAQSPEKYLGATIDINAPIDTVWSRWSSTRGISRFMASQSTMELQTLGRFDVLFDPSAPEGKRGAENNRILAWQPNKMLSFTWDAPSTYPEIRKQRTFVVIRFNELPGKKTNVTLIHTGFGTGADWDAVYNYFSTAWSSFVLPRLKQSCEVPGTTLANMPKDLPPAKKL